MKITIAMISAYLYILFFIGVVLLFLHILLVLFSSRKEPTYKFFYKDMKDIVDKRIENIKTKSVD